MSERVKVTYCLEDILQKIDEKLDKIEDNFTKRFQKVESKLKSNQQEFKQEIKEINSKLDTIQKDVKDLKSWTSKIRRKSR